MGLLTLEDMRHVPELDMSSAARGRRLFQGQHGPSEADRVLELYYRGQDFEKKDNQFYFRSSRKRPVELPRRMAEIVKARAVLRKATINGFRTQWWHCGRWMLTAENGDLRVSPMFLFLRDGRRRNGTAECHLG